MYLLSVFHATTRFFMGGFRPQNALVCSIHNCVLSSFVSIATRFYFDFPHKLVHLVVLFFSLRESLTVGKK